jgi:hypothetical protein
LNFAYLGAVLFLGVGFVFQVIVFGFLLGFFWDMFGGKKK